MTGWRGEPRPTFALMALLMMVAPLAAEQNLAVPSGQLISLGEVLIDDSQGETWVRFRFIAPQIGEGDGQITYETSSGDMDYLCENLVLPYLAQYALEPARVVISLSNRHVPFGSPDPEATQFFDIYRPEEATCIWEAF